MNFFQIFIRYLSETLENTCFKLFQATISACFSCMSLVAPSYCLSKIPCDGTGPRVFRKINSEIQPCCPFLSSAYFPFFIPEIFSPIRRSVSPNVIYTLNFKILPTPNTSHILHAFIVGLIFFLSYADKFMCCERSIIQRCQDKGT
jgi:hypothetical protein